MLTMTNDDDDDDPGASQDDRDGGDSHIFTRITNYGYCAKHV